MHIEGITNGLGGPSMYALMLACWRKIPATVSITADTGWETDCVLSTGERCSVPDFFSAYVKPLADRYGIDARLVRAVDNHKQPMPSIVEYHEMYATKGTGMPVMPMFGSKGGRAPQKCTSRWKIAAIRQEYRRMGATSQRSAQALHNGELRRVRGANPRVVDGWHTYSDIDGVRNLLQADGSRKRTPRILKWSSHYYPLIDLGMDRYAVDLELQRLKIPYIVGSQCDGCPHKDRSRWLRSSPETIQRLAEIEARTPGWFFTSKRIPLLKVIDQWQSQHSLFGDESDFGCDSGAYCGV